MDAGGGLGIDYNDSPTEPRFDAARKVREYAAALGKAAAGLGAVHLLVEPGRFVVAQAGGLLTRVLFVKKNGAKTFVITDAAMNDLIRPALYQAHHEILPVKQGRGATAKVDVVGPVCESGDFFARDREMPRVKAGELLLVLDAGAYGMSESFELQHARAGGGGAGGWGGGAADPAAGDAAGVDGGGDCVEH